MDHPQDFEWKGIGFTWRWHRLANKADILLSGKTYWLLVRQTLPDAWESWVEFEGGYTQACTMTTRELALEGAVLALKDFFEASLKDLERFTP